MRLGNFPDARAMSGFVGDPRRLGDIQIILGGMMTGNVRRIFAAAVLAFVAVCGAAIACAAVTSPDAHQTLGFLNQTIDWYRHLGSEEQLADQPTDVLFVYNDRDIASQVLSLSFDFARANAQILAAANGQTAADIVEEAPTQYQNISQLAARAQDSIQQKKQKLDALKQRLQTARTKDRAMLQSEIDETQSALELAQTRSDALNNLVQFSAGADSSAKGNSLLAQINELEQSVPGVHSTAQTAAGSTKTASNTNASSNAPLQTAARPAPSGILGIASDLWSIRSKTHTLDASLAMTGALQQSAKTLIAPLSSALRDATKQGEDLSNLPDSTNPQEIEQRKRQIEALEAQFKSISVAALPLAKQNILLDRYKANLTNWNQTLAGQRTRDVRGLAIRLATLGIALLATFAIFEVLRRLIYHYIHDLRRRNLILLLRRIFMFVAFATVIAISFSTDLRSFTTFAGLLAAGIAVCLQNVILSGVGYFVLLGKYGIRVGDRIEISGVTGNVVDIDLMRLSLMELGPSGASGDLVPTGRTVEFPNAIVFQPTAGLFKQIPGANFLWHEVTLTLSADSDFRASQDRMMVVVNGIYAKYKENFEQQHRRMESSLNLPVELPQPQLRMRFTQSGPEVIIRYPVTREKATEIDDQITRALLDVMHAAPQVKSVESATQSAPAAATQADASLKHAAATT
jgi:small-conductance mechanosensitive channel